MAETWNGNKVPAEDDRWNLVADIRRLAILNNRVIPVYSKAERDALSAAAGEGAVPDGTVVLRMDQVAKGGVFDVYADGKWYVGDTGIITSGISIQAAPNFKIESYSLVRTGSMVTARVDASYTGPDIEANSTNGNIVDTAVFTLESGWSPIWATYDVAWTFPGTSAWFGRVDSGGGAAITHGLPGNTFKKTHALRLDGSWRIA